MVVTPDTRQNSLQKRSSSNIQPNRTGDRAASGSYDYRASNPTSIPGEMMIFVRSRCGSVWSSRNTSLGSGSFYNRSFVHRTVDARYMAAKWRLILAEGATKIYFGVSNGQKKGGLNAATTSSELINRDFRVLGENP